MPKAKPARPASTGVNLPGSLGSAEPDKSQTVIWGSDVERDDSLKVPRTLLRLGRYDPVLAKQLKARHILLLLALASRKFKNKPIRAYWGRAC